MPLGEVPWGDFVLVGVVLLGLPFGDGDRLGEGVRLGDGVPLGEGVRLGVGDLDLD